MKINDLEFHFVEIGCAGLSKPIRSLLVRLTTDSGLKGWGEAAVPWRAGELLLRREAILPILAGRSIFDIEELHTLEALSVAPLRAAVEMACWDLIGRAVGQPLYRLLGGQYRQRIPLAVRLMGRRSERLGSVAREMAAQGFHCQIISSTGQVQLDRQLLAAVRESVGDRMELRLDGLGHYDLETARELCAEIEYDHLQFLLDPLDTRELYPIVSLGRQTSVPLAVRRAIRGAADVLSVVRCGAAPFVVLDFEALGGLTPTRNCAAIARAGGVAALLGGRPTLGIATAALLHLAAATPALSGCNEFAYHQLQDDVLVESLPIEGGMMTVPQGPGLGVEVNRAKIERYAAA
jgi:L-alanine-DL-glutamate epimerase-like enolase superfamily enzyme